jgi:hypothetical protein
MRKERGHCCNGLHPLWHLAQPVKAAWPTWDFRPGMKLGSTAPPPPHSPPARGSSIESGWPAESGPGRRCQGASPGGEGPNLVHRQRRGSPWWARGNEAGQQWGTDDGRLEKRWRAPSRGSWSGGELGRRSLRWRRSMSVAGGGARREGDLGKWRRRPARCFNRSFRRTVAQRPAWRGGHRLVLGAEADDERQSRVGGCPAAVVGRGENRLLLRTDSKRRRRIGRWLHALRVETGRQVARSERHPGARVQG